MICVHLIQHSLCFHGRGTDSSSSTPLWKNHFCSNTDTFLCVILKSGCLYLKKEAGSQALIVETALPVSTKPLMLPCSSNSPFSFCQTCLCWWCPCVCSPQLMALNFPPPSAPGMGAMDGILAAGMGSTAPCPSTNTSTRNHLLSAKCKICSLLLSGRRNLKLVQMFKHTSLLNYSVYSACSWS